MPVQISALRVMPEMDASKYVAGAQEKIAADKAMAASSAAAGQAVTATDAKISASGDILARLSRQYVQGYSAQQKFNQGLGQLNRGLEAGKISVEGAERILVGMNAKLGLMGDASDLAAKGQIQLAAAVRAANAQIAGQTIAAENAGAAVRRAHAANSNVSMFNTANIAAQFQDIGVTSAMGMNPLQIALQQGTQLSSVFEMMKSSGQSAGGALLAAFTSLISPISLLTIGITAAAAVTIQWFMKGKDGANSMADAISKNSDAVRDLADAYGMAKFNVDELGKKTIIAAEAAERMSRRQLESQIRQSGIDIQGKTTPSDYMTFGMLGSGNERTVDARFAAFTAPILQLRKALSEGKADFATLEQIQKEIEAIAGQGYGPFRTFVDDMARVVGMKPEGIRETADQLQIIVSQLAEAQRRLEQLQNINRDGRGGRLVGPNRMDAAQEAGRLAAEQQRREREARFANDEEVFQARLQMERARTNAERLAAAERTARAEKGDVSVDVRVSRALAEERNRQAVEARDAAIQRSQSIERSLQQQRLELALIGKTTGETAKLRFEFERMQELREQAARTGTPIDEKEVASIKAAAEEMGKYADAIARAKLNNDLQFERSQLFRTPGEQAIASRLRGTGLGMNSSEAQYMRESQQFADAKNLVTSFLSDFESGLVDSGGDIGKALGNAVLNGVNSILDKIIASLFDQLGNELASAITGVSSSGGSGGSSLLGSVVNSIFGSKSAANDNYATGAVTRSPLPDISKAVSSGVSTGMEAYRSAIASIESVGNGGYSALGPIHKVMGQALGRYQIMEANLASWSKEALGRTVGRSEFMRSPGVQDAIFDHKFGSYVDKYGPSGAASMWFTGRPSAPNATDVLGTSGSSYVQQFNDALTKTTGGLGKFGEVAGKAVPGVGMLGRAGAQATQGLSTFANNLSRFPAAPSGGGLGGLFGSLFGGGLNPAFSGTAAFSWLSANPGGMVNFYADGTENAPPGWAWVGEKGPELLRMRGGEQVRSNARSMQMANQNSRSGPVVNFNVINNAGAEIRTEERRENDGSMSIDVIVDRLAAKNLTTRGTATNNALRGGFGARQVLKRG